MSYDNFDSGKEFEASWHLAPHLINFFGNHLTLSGSNFLAGRLDKYFWHLNLIKRRLMPFLKEDEQIEIRILDKELKTLEPMWKIKPMKVNVEFSNKLEEYDSMIMKFLKKYGFLVPPKEDRTQLIG